MKKIELVRDYYTPNNKLELYEFGNFNEKGEWEGYYHGHFQALYGQIGLEDFTGFGGNEEGAIYVSPIRMSHGKLIITLKGRGHFSHYQWVRQVISLTAVKFVDAEGNEVSAETALSNELALHEFKFNPKNPDSWKAQYRLYRYAKSAKGEKIYPHKITLKIGDEVGRFMIPTTNDQAFEFMTGAAIPEWPTFTRRHAKLAVKELKSMGIEAVMFQRPNPYPGVESWEVKAVKAPTLKLDVPDGVYLGQSSYSMGQRIRTVLTYAKTDEQFNVDLQESESINPYGLVKAGRWHQLVDPI